MVGCLLCATWTVLIFDLLGKKFLCVDLIPGKQVYFQQKFNIYLLWSQLFHHVAIKYPAYFHSCNGWQVSHWLQVYRSYVCIRVLVSVMFVRIYGMYRRTKKQDTVFSPGKNRHLIFIDFFFPWILEIPLYAKQDSWLSLLQRIRNFAMLMFPFCEIRLIVLKCGISSRKRKK